jgi:hypothetical protein
MMMKKKQKHHSSKKDNISRWQIQAMMVVLVQQTMGELKIITSKTHSNKWPLLIM